MHYHYFTLEQRSNLERVIRATVTPQPVLEEALQRLHGAGYGVCQHCGGDIPYVELEQRPLALLCARCRAGRTA